MGFKVFYGDATRIDILKSAGAAEAKILIAAIDSPDINFDLVEKTKNTFPDLTVMVRAKSRLDAYELLDMGIKDVYRESLDTSVRLGVDVLVKLGVRKYSAVRASQNFIKYDETAMRELARHRHDQSDYIFTTREQIQIQEQMLNKDIEVNPNINDHAWDSDLFEEKSDTGKN
jgi:CPA2 family monovalent cation:H+ antiporter-2